MNDNTNLNMLGNGYLEYQVFLIGPDGKLRLRTNLIVNADFILVRPFPEKVNAIAIIAIKRQALTESGQYGHDVSVSFVYGDGTTSASYPVVRKYLGTIADVRINSRRDILVVGKRANVTSIDTSDQTRYLPNRDVFIRVVDSVGSLRWEREFDGLELSTIRSSYIDDLGRVVLCGDTPQGFDECGDTFPDSTKGTNMAFILAYDTDGACLFKKHLDSRGYDKAIRVARDNNGRFYVAVISSVAREIAPDLPRTLSGPCKSLDCFVYEFELPSVSHKP
jgi:hypothetical protein